MESVVSVLFWLLRSEEEADPTESIIMSQNLLQIYATKLFSLIVALSHCF